MVSIVSLWLPILLSAIFVFVVSSILHMVLKYHQSDYSRVPSEDEVMEALRRFDVPPGDYMLPCGEGMESLRSEAFQEKYKKGPVALITFMKPGPPAMGASLLQWFVYSVVVGIFAAYIAGRALGPGASYLAVFRFAGCTAFVGYALALWQNTIWYKRRLGTTLKSTFDGLVYAGLTAGTFGWLWPS